MIPRVEQLPVALSPNGGLAVASNGQTSGIATLSFATGADRSITATLHFAGSSQAVITFDSTGTIPLSYVLYNPAPTVFIDQSVRNIIEYLSQRRLAM